MRKQQRTPHEKQMSGFQMRDSGQFLLDLTDKINMGVGFLDLTVKKYGGWETYLGLRLWFVQVLFKWKLPCPMKRA